MHNIGRQGRVGIGRNPIKFTAALVQVVRQIYGVLRSLNGVKTPSGIVVIVIVRIELEPSENYIPLSIRPTLADQ